MSAAPALIQGSVFDAALDAAYETHRQFRHGAFAEACPTCHVPAGELCLARRSVHAARRQAHRARAERTRLSPLQHKNLNDLGRYSFTASTPASGGLRPLRHPDAARTRR